MALGLGSQASRSNTSLADLVAKVRWEKKVEPRQHLLVVARQRNPMFAWRFQGNLIAIVVAVVVEQASGREEARS